MSKRTYPSEIVNKRPTKITQAQKNQAIQRFGFINGGRFLRSPQVQQRYGTSGFRAKTGEVKGVDGNVDIPEQIVNTTTTNQQIFVMNLVQQGTGSWNRVGRKIRLKSLRVKGILTFANANNQDCVQNTVRMIVVWDKQPSGNTIPTFDDIIGGTDQAGTESSGFLSNVRYDNTERFSILKDEVFNSSYNVANAVTVAQNQTNFDCFIKLKGMQTVFSGQSNPMTIADISTGGLYVIFRAQNQDNPANYAIVINSNTRLRYYDN